MPFERKTDLRIQKTKNAIKETFKEFFTFMADQEPYMEKIVCSASYREFADKFFMSMLRHNRRRHNPYAAFSPEEQNIINNFLALTSSNIYRQWVRFLWIPLLN